MYRKLKNLLGVSFIILAILISQLPMPQTNAEPSDKKSPVTVTFNMNGGTFNGKYMGYSLENQMPVAVLDKNEAISEFPSENAASYSGYKTVADTWYTDKECLNEFDKKSNISESVTLYKRWYSVTDDGFYLNPDKTVLYKYDGSGISIDIPDTVETIAADAFDDLNGVRGISLGPNIKTVQENAFSGVNNQDSIIYVYDTGSAQSERLGKQLDDEYGQLVHSAYLDMEEVEEIAGIDYMIDDNANAQTETENDTPTEENTENSDIENTNVESTEENTDNISTAESDDAEKNPEKTDVIETAAGTFDNDTNPVSGISINEDKIIVGNGISPLAAAASEQSGVMLKDLKNVLAAQKSEEETDTSNELTDAEGAGTSQDSADAERKDTSQKPVDTEIADTKSQEISETEDKGHQAASEQDAEEQTTTEKKSPQSASGPRSSEHVLDSTPKTGDAVQYRLLITICLFSMGLLLILTGNGNKRKSAVS